MPPQSSQTEAAYEMVVIQHKHVALQMQISFKIAVLYALTINVTAPPQ